MDTHDPIDPKAIDFPQSSTQFLCACDTGVVRVDLPPTPEQVVDIVRNNGESAAEPASSTVDKHATREKCGHWWKKRSTSTPLPPPPSLPSDSMTNESPTQSSTVSSSPISPTLPASCALRGSCCEFCAAKEYAQEQESDLKRDQHQRHHHSEQCSKHHQHDKKRSAPSRPLYSLSSAISSASTTNMLEASSILRRLSPRRRHSSSLSSDRYSWSFGSWRRRLSRKGVKYSHDGSVERCRFCEILATKSEDFLYEDEFVAVFRPLFPVSESHVLVVPKLHIQNVKKLTYDHVFLLERMKQVAEFVLLGQDELCVHPIGLGVPSSCASSDIDQPLWLIPSPTDSSADVSMASGSSSGSSPTTELKFAFHLPPFNSIDHVHMHVFRRHTHRSRGVVNTVKFQTKTWWCHSYEQVLTRLYRQRHVKS